MPVLLYIHHDPIEGQN